MARNVDGVRSKGDGAATKRGWGRAVLKGLIAISLFVVFSGLIAYAYNKGKEDGGGGTPPIIKAGPAPYKVKPDRPGGMEVANRDKEIYSQITGAKKPSVVERLLPPAETPMTSTAAAPVPAPTTAPPQKADAAPVAPPASSVPPKAVKPTVVSKAPPPAPKPPKKPVAKSEANRVAKIVPAAGGDYKIQLASLRTTDAVGKSWKRLMKANKDLLGGLKLTVVRRNLGSGKGVYYRMQAGPLPDSAAARDLCGRLKRRKLSCLVIKP